MTSRCWPTLLLWIKSVFPGEDGNLSLLWFLLSDWEKLPCLTNYPPPWSSSGSSFSDRKHEKCPPLDIHRSRATQSPTGASSQSGEKTKRCFLIYQELPLKYCPALILPEKVFAQQNFTPNLIQYLNSKNTNHRVGVIGMHFYLLVCSNVARSKVSKWWKMTSLAIDDDMYPHGYFYFD